MKEYICKDDLVRHLKMIDGDMKEAVRNVENWDFTITKTGICREFAERIKEMFDFCSKNAMGIIDIDVAKGLVDKVLAETEKEE